MSEISVSLCSIRRRIVDRVAQTSRIASGPSKNAAGLLSLDTGDERAFRKVPVAPWQTGRPLDGLEPAAPGSTAATRLRDAHVFAQDIRYLEAHGSSTSLGDPIEFMQSASSAPLPVSTSARCDVGSVKSDIGYMESAAGLARVLEVVAAKAHRRLPASIRVTTVNSRMSLLGELAVSEEIRHYPGHERPTNSTGTW